MGCRWDAICTSWEADKDGQGVGEGGDDDGHPGVPHHQAQPVGERPALVLLPQALLGHHQGQHVVNAEAWVGG